MFFKVSILRYEISLLITKNDRYLLDLSEQNSHEFNPLKVL